MNGLTLLIWGAVSGLGAMLFLAMVAHDLERRRLELHSQSEQERIRLLSSQASDDGNHRQSKSIGR